MSQETKQEKTNRIAKNTLFMFLRMLLVVGVGLYTSRVVLATLGIGDFGIYSLVGSIVVWLAFLKNALNNATYRFLAYELGRGDKLMLHHTFIMCVKTHFLLALLILVPLECLGSWFINGILDIDTDRLTAANWAFQFSVICFLVEIIRTPFSSCIIVHERLDFYALTGIIEVFLKLGVVYCLVLFIGDKLILYAGLIAAVSILIAVWYVIYCFTHFPECRFQSYWNNSLLKKLLVYFGWSALVNAVDLIVTLTHQLLFNKFGGVIANGAMGISNMVNSQLNGFLSNFTQSFNPQIIKSYAEGEKNYFMKMVFSTSKLSYFLLFSVAFPLYVFVDFVLKVWLVNSPAMAGQLIQLVILYLLIDSFSTPLWQTVHATGRLKVHQLLMAGIKILNIPVSFFLLWYGYPLPTVLKVWVVLNGVCAIVRIVYMKWLINFPLRKYAVSVLCRLLLVSVLAAVVPLWYAHLMGTDNWMALLGFLGLFFTVYIVLVYTVGLNAQEKDMLWGMVKKKLPF